MVVIGYIFGFVFGFVAAVYVAYRSDENAVRDGVIKLCGSIYKLEKIDV